MKRTILVDGMFCLYDNDFNLNNELLDLVDSIDARKILVVNGFREKGKEVLKGTSIKEAFSLEEEGIKKDNPEYFKNLFSKFNLKPEEVIYFDHNETNVKAGKSLGIISIQYTDGDFLKIKNFIKDNINS